MQNNIQSKRRLWLAGFAVVLVGGAATAMLGLHATEVTAGVKPAAPAPVPVTVATVERREVRTWAEFSGRLEAVEHVDIRSRVAGTVQAVHFREGGLVKAGELLISIDPAPFAAEVDRAQAQVTAAEARVAYTTSEHERARRLWEVKAIAERELEARSNARREAEAQLQAARAALQSARLNLGYTQVRAPIGGRVGKLEVTVGNLVAAGPGAPVLTTLVSVDPIYASFDADEELVARTLAGMPGGGQRLGLERIPVRMLTGSTGAEMLSGHLQLVDNQVDSASGTVRLRAVFDNRDGRLMPGQFARVGLGRPSPEAVLLISERAVGTDQNKRYVMVVGADDRAEYREVTLGDSVDGQRIVTSGLQAGERIVVNGLQRVRPGGAVAPEGASAQRKANTLQG